MLSLCVLTTHKDASAPLLITPDILTTWEIETMFYEDVIQSEKVPVLAATHVYLRDPFNAAISPEEVRPFLEAFLKANRESVYIDTISRVEDIFLEDKWYQYQVFSEFMPQTFLAAEHALSEGRPLYKKRISSRARGISFDRPQTNLEHYIVQERLDIAEEYRVIEVAKEILGHMLVKSSKTETQRVKVQKAMPISEDVHEFVSRVQQKHAFDLVGYDVARTPDNQLYLIEVNRSPQIRAFVRETGINPFALLLDKIAKRSG